ncbi:MAG: SoxR reducing system RseC family protein [Bacteroidota bacterium]
MTSPHNNIEHPGIIDRIEKDRIWVSIMPQSACGNCQSKSYCGMAEVAEKIVEVQPKSTAQQYKAGQKVVISLKRSLGYRALFLGYLLPFLVVMITLITTLSITGNEALSAVLSLLVVIPYYTILYWKKEAIKSSFRFYIKQ